MTIATLLRIAAPTALLMAGAAQAADRGGTRSADSLPALPQASTSASDKSQGLPNAGGEKPGRGEGQGHVNERGRGHEMGRGHGHDSDPDSPG